MTMGWGGSHEGPTGGGRKRIKPDYGEGLKLTEIWEKKRHEKTGAGEKKEGTRKRTRERKVIC